MKLLTIALGLSLVAISCIACHVATEVQEPVRSFEFSGPSALLDDAEKADKTEDKFYVSFELVIHVSQVAEHKATTEALLHAIQEWVSHLPVRVIVYFEDPDTNIAGMPSPPSPLDRYGVIEIVMADLQDDFYGFSDGLLGLWFPGSQTILLDADYLDTNPDLAFSVALHELGHMFGIPHVANANQPAYTGSVVLPLDKAAEEYVMYYRSVSEHPQNELSEIEILLARHNVMHWWTNPAGPHKVCECELTHDH